MGPAPTVFSRPVSGVMPLGADIGALGGASEVTTGPAGRAGGRARGGSGTVGIYGVIAYTSAQRAGEMATRLALGAKPVEVFWLMMRRGFLLVAVGVAFGLAAAYAGGRAVASTVYGVDATDATVLVTAAVVVVVVAWIATAIPARNAARTDPILALRGGA